MRHEHEALPALLVRKHKKYLPPNPRIIAENSLYIIRYHPHSLPDPIRARPVPTHKI